MPDTLYQDARVALQRSSRRDLVDEWALVLLSQGLHPGVRADAGAWVLSVPLEEAAPAAASLAAYIHENPAPLHEDEAAESAAFATAEAGGLQTSLVVGGALLLFFLVTGPRDPEVAWFAQGSADAAKLMGGELWRSVTALTLHADLLHVVSNAILGAVLLGALCGLLGSGVACTLVLLSGAIGNTLNAALQSPLHVSVGASTAVFGALGILAALGVIRRRTVGVRGKHAWIPVAAGLGLLAMLGTGGERVDLWAHLLGFAAGAGVGLAYAALRVPRPHDAVQRRLATLALASVGVCWLLALR